MPSRFEGFPNALAESMSCGIPSLATDSPSAVRDLTLNGRLARLSELTPEAIAKNIEDLIGNPSELVELNFLGKRVKTYFRDANTLDEWQDLISWVLGGRETDHSQCRACSGRLGKSIALRTRGGLRRELHSAWNIEVDTDDMGSNPIITARRCKKCRSMNFSGSQGNSLFYEACYKSDIYSRVTPWDYEIQLSRIQSTGRKLHVLDFGGGISPFTKLVSSEIELSVVDLSLKVHEELEHLNVFVYSDLSQIPSTMKFDHICLSHTIEHVDDPRALVMSLVDFLNPGASIYVTTPDARHPFLLSSPLAWPPHHTVAFTSAALAELLKSAGLKNIEVVRNSEQLNANFDFMVIGEL
jgi:2-polyprenyl-3-methyl-5-hydroxy-6-metoxy-1,4-benzoquinol methylase